MRELLPFLFSVIFAFAALAETVHAYEQACETPCPAVCLGGACGTYCDNPDLKCSLAPAEHGRPAAACSEAVFAQRLSADEIFHPPVV